MMGQDHLDFDGDAAMSLAALERICPHAQRAECSPFDFNRSAATALIFRNSFYYGTLRAPRADHITCAFEVTLFNAA